VANDKRCHYRYQTIESIIEKGTCPYPYFVTYVDPETNDETDYCIFHAPIEAKMDHKEELREMFDEVIKGVYRQHDNKPVGDTITLDCQGFIIPTTNVFSHIREFPFNVDFSFARFFEPAYAVTTKFLGSVYFMGTRFHKKVHFNHVQFLGPVRFDNAVFSEDADFSGVSFNGEADFSTSRFLGNADFSGVRFSGNARFERALCEGSANFEHAVFSNGGDFAGVIFSNDVNFVNAKFKRYTSFRRTGFASDADFAVAQFASKADFRIAQFSNDANFEAVDFGAQADFERARFLGYTDFRRITVDKDSENAGTFFLRYAFFSDPNRVYIGGPGVKKSSFIGTNIEGVHFVDAEWPRRKGLFKKYRKKAFDEELAEKVTAKDEKTDEDFIVNWEDAVEVYRKLRRNYEGRLAYETAGDFHYGQMECRRRDPNRPWWDRTITWFYKKLFSYGENISKPLILVGFSFLVFTGFFLLHGFPLTDGPVVNWDWGFDKLFVGVWWKQLGSSTLFTIRSAFSFNVPPGGNNSLAAIMFAWKLVAVTLSTFFVLALRRRFKR
jgi:uncharacterized protein YjbI with pentapeptide repeats